MVQDVVVGEARKYISKSLTPPHCPDLSANATLDQVKGGRGEGGGAGGYFNAALPLPDSLSSEFLSSWLNLNFSFQLT